MGRLIEDLNLRNKIRVFRDRAEAGRLLSEKIKHLASSGTIILAIPAGGVPVGYEIAKGNGSFDGCPYCEKNPDSRQSGGRIWSLRS